MNLCVSCVLLGTLCIFIIYLHNQFVLHIIIYCTIIRYIRYNTGGTYFSFIYVSKAYSHDNFLIFEMQYILSSSDFLRCFALGFFFLTLSLTLEYLIGECSKAIDMKQKWYLISVWFKENELKNMLHACTVIRYSRELISRSRKASMK